MFLQNVYTAFTQVMILVLLAAVGLCCHKGGLFTEETARKCNGLLFYIVTPAVICHSFVQLERSAETIKLLLYAFIGGLLFHIVGILITKFLFNRSPHGGIYKYASMYGNIGYMGIPLSRAVLGNEGVFICSVVIFVFNLLCFTHGVAVMEGKREKVNLKKILINPGTIGLAIGLPLYLINVELPDILLEPLTHISSLNTPLAMIMLGTYLGGSKPTDIFKTRENYAVLFIKMILLPALTLGTCMIIGISGTLAVAFVLLACVPTASNTAMLAAQCGKNTARASMCVALCTVTSVITMPVWIALAQTL